MGDARELPILFTPEMAQKVWLREKVQTRRPVKFDFYDLRPEQEWCLHPCKDGTWEVGIGSGPGGHAVDYLKSPFWGGSEVLYVRETFQGLADGRWWHEAKKEDRALWNWDLVYRGEHESIDVTPGLEWLHDVPKWIPSIHMPKWASRMKLRVKRVWVERVQDIDNEGAIAEGYTGQTAGVIWFEKLWNELYGTWEENPFVWCCKFELGEFSVGNHSSSGFDST